MLKCAKLQNYTIFYPQRMLICVADFFFCCPVNFPMAQESFPKRRVNRKCKIGLFFWRTLLLVFQSSAFVSVYCWFSSVFLQSFYLWNHRSWLYDCIFSWWAAIYSRQCLDVSHLMLNFARDSDSLETRCVSFAAVFRHQWVQVRVRSASLRRAV